MNARNKKTTVALALVAAALALGFVGAERSGLFDKVESKLDQAMGWSVPKGCLRDAGSTEPYPASGVLPLSKEQEKERAVPRFASLSAKSGKGMVALSNEDEAPALALFIDEDGAPVARGFIRGGEVVKMALPAGAYDVMVHSGQDWNGRFFVGCARELKAKGIVVVEPEKASEVVMFADMAFVLSNRMDTEEASKMLDNDKKRRSGKLDSSLDAEPKRPSREERPSL